MPRRIVTKTEEEAAPTTSTRDRSGWLEQSYEGQLAVDVFQTKDDVLVKSTIAGVRPEDLDIAINNDMVTIRGVRQQLEQVNEADYFYQECYWGGFSRSIILPVDVHADRAKATLKNGVLTIRIPKVQKTKVQVVRVKTEDES